MHIFASYVVLLSFTFPNHIILYVNFTFCINLSNPEKSLALLKRNYLPKLDFSKHFFLYILKNPKQGRIVRGPFNLSLYMASSNFVSSTISSYFLLPIRRLDKEANRVNAVQVSFIHFYKLNRNYNISRRCRIAIIRFIQSR